MTLAIVVTTVQQPSLAVRDIASLCQARDVDFVIIGDLKTPSGWACPGTHFLEFGESPAGDWQLPSVLRPNSYTRKMLGYIWAAARGASWIRETDDDNRPYESFLDDVPQTVTGREPASKDRFINIYRYFSDRFVWPRGFPLNLVAASSISSQTEAAQFDGPVVFQAVADGDPDVDAVYRLTAPDRSAIRFDNLPPLVVPSDCWVPFNSQATTWPISLLPLMYLPATCSFRMTDIWRSYIAQRLFPGLGTRLVVTSPNVFQDRNDHDLMRDFHDEIEGYIGYERFVDVLEATEIFGTPDRMLNDLRLLYSALIAAGFFSSEEIIILDAWIADMITLGYGPAA